MLCGPASGLWRSWETLAAMEGEDEEEEQMEQPGSMLLLRFDNRAQPDNNINEPDVTGSSRESTTDIRVRSTDISIHLSPARRGESDSLGADSVALTIHRNNITSPIHITHRYRDLEVHDN